MRLAVFNNLEFLPSYLYDHIQNESVPGSTLQVLLKFQGEIKLLQFESNSLDPNQQGYISLEVEGQTYSHTPITMPENVLYLAPLTLLDSNYLDFALEQKDLIIFELQTENDFNLTVSKSNFLLEIQ